MKETIFYGPRVEESFIFIFLNQMQKAQTIKEGWYIWLL